MINKNQWMKHVGYQTAYTEDSAYNTSGEGTSVTGTVYDLQVAYNNQYSVSYMFPPGFMGIPVDNRQAIVGKVGITDSYVVLGMTPTASNDALFSDMSPGECGIKSNGDFALVARNDKLQYLYNALRATPCSGEDVQQILIDYAQQFIDINTTLNAIWTQLNSHTHVQTDHTNTESMTSSGTTITPTTIDPNVISDKSFCESGKLLIDENGVTPVR